ncbi:hypothetical protein KSF78_0008401 [Schistosoma japonicum]|nr:hypothetical protein KSF78_0008401 [Schistosoma japonicum]
MIIINNNNNNNNNEYFIFLLILLLSIEFYGINGEVQVTLNYHRINTTTTTTTTITTTTTTNHHNQNDSLINDQYTLPNTSIILSSYNKQWNFHLDMFIIIFLALFSFCANTGLLYLDRCAKSSNIMNNSSFSNNFISFTTTTNNTTNTTTTTNNNSSNNNNISTNTTYYNSSTSNLPIHNTNNNKLQSSSFNCILKKWLNQCNSHRINNNLLCNQSSMQRIPHEIITTSKISTGLRSFSITNSTLNKYPSSISLLKLNHTNQIIHHGSTQFHYTPRSRRQRRYLRGLLGLSISNLSLSVCLLNWCICQIILYHIYNIKNYYTLKVWLTIIAFLNIWTIDIAQTLEISAILWIALEPSTYSLINIIQQIKKQRVLLLHNTQHFQQHHHQQQQHLIDYISDIKTTYIKHTSSIDDSNINNNNNTNSYIQYFNSFIIYNYYYAYFTNDLFKKHTSSSSSSSPSSSSSSSSSPSSSSSTPSTFHAVHLKHQTHMYYTNSIILALIIGQFFIPLTILVTTNLLIYQKVSINIYFLYLYSECYAIRAM